MLETTISAIIDSNEKKDDGMYFCVLLSYVRYGQRTQGLEDKMYRKRMYESDESSQDEEEEKKDEEIVDLDYKIDYLEVSIFESPSAICPINQIKKKSMEHEAKQNGNIENALDPTLCFQFLCDFKLQRVVEYFDIFGISAEDGSENQN